MSSSHNNLESTTLALFFTWGISMQVWAEKGMLEREVALYNELAEELDHIYLFTYGDESDFKYSDQLASNVSIVPKSGVSSNLLYSFLCPIIQRRTLRKVDLLKTNQMLGSWTAMIAKTLFRIPLIIRTGFVLSLFYAKREQPPTLRLVVIILESIAYFYADGVITSSPHGFDYVENRYLVRGGHRYIPNYVETDLFRPMDVEKDSNSICYVGRLDEQKNLFSLFEALVGSPFELTAVGSGEYDTELREFAEVNDLSVTFLGNLPNHELPELINRHEMFILPSYFEGMPKTLLEAMACCQPVVGTNVIGIREVIVDGVTGLLCGTDPTVIREAITRLMTDPSLRESLGTNARKQIKREFSLARVRDAEVGLYREVLALDR